MHKSTEQFLKVLEWVKETHLKKSKDYGTDTDPFANLRACESLGISAIHGVLIRMGDKWARLQSFAKKGELVNESVEDTLLDTAVYSIIALVLLHDSTGASKGTHTNDTPTGFGGQDTSS